MKFISSDKVFSHLDRLSQWSECDLVPPITVEVHPSNKCSNKCVYCIAEDLKDGRMMSRDELLKAIGFLDDVGVRGIIFTGGGEPTLNPFIIDGIESASHLGLSMGLITNGMHLTGKLARVVLRNCEWVRVSLDASDRETYKKIRGVDAYSIVRKNLSELVKLKKRLKSDCTIGTQMVVNEFNYDKILRFVLSFKRVDCVKVRPLSFEASGLNYIQVRPLEAMVEEKPYSVLMKKRILEDLDFVRKGVGGCPHVIVSDKWDIVFSGSREYGFSGCHCAEMIGAVDAYGDFYLCCHTVKNAKYKLFNVFTGDWKTFLFERRKILDKCKIMKKVDPLACPVGCRGSNINRRLEGLMGEKEHDNFL